MKKQLSTIFLTLLLTSMLGMALNIQPVKAEWTGTVYIRADGSIDPSDAPVITYDNVTYTLTDNITSSADGIVVERDNIVIDGAGYTLQGTGSGKGVDLSGRTNVTVQNTQIKNFDDGISLEYNSKYNSVVGNNITANNWAGIWLIDSSNNSISGNNIANNAYGIYLYYSSNNNIVSGNNITANFCHGIVLDSSSNYNSISGNNIYLNVEGMHLISSSYNLLHNNTLSGNTYNFGVSGGASHHFYNYVNKSNLVNGRPILYSINSTNAIFDAKTNAGTVYIVNGKNITVKDLTLTENFCGVFFWNVTNSLIQNITATSNIYGVRLQASRDNIVSGNNLTANRNSGIEFFTNIEWEPSSEGCRKNIIKSNFLSKNYYGARFASDSRDNQIFNNTLLNNEFGIALHSANNNTIVGNQILSQNQYGVQVYSSQNNSVLQNNFANCWSGIHIAGGAFNTVKWNNFINSTIVITASRQNLISNNTDIYMVHVAGESLNNTIAFNTFGTIFYYGASILIQNSSYNVILSNSIEQNGPIGILLEQFSSYNNISQNNITNKSKGIQILALSECNTLYKNNIKNSITGIEICYSSHNILKNNSMSNNRYNLEVIGVYLFHFINDVDTSNKVDDKPVYYLVNEQNTEVPNDAGYVALINCTQITVKNLQLSNNRNGILLAFTSNSTVTGNSLTKNNYGLEIFESSNNFIIGNSITENHYRGIELANSNNNTFSNNNLRNDHCAISFSNSSYNSISGNNITANFYHGIWLIDSSNNSISGNNIANNAYGIRLNSSSNNVIYHNNFVDNSQQVDSYASTNVWDDGYPSGGNYWSDYTGVDDNGDGIGDSPYVIDIENIDHFPLMNPHPWSSHDVAITSLTTSKTVVPQGYNLNISLIAFNYGGYTENFTITVYANTTIIHETNVNLTSRNSITVSFTLNTTGFAEGNYTVWAYAWPVQGEIDTEDNTFVYGVVTVTIPGDVDGDFDVDILDVVKITGIYAFRQGDPTFNPNSDIDNDGEITILDVVICTSHYGQTHP